MAGVGRWRLVDGGGWAGEAEVEVGDRGRHQKGGRLTVGEGEQVEVTCRLERVREPSGVEHGALEDKEFPVRRDTEPKEKSLEHVSGERTLEVGLLLSREVLQQRPYRSGDIPRLTRHRRPPFPDRVSDPKPPCILRGSSPAMRVCRKRQGRNTVP